MRVRACKAGADTRRVRRSRAESRPTGSGSTCQCAGAAKRMSSAPRGLRGRGRGCGRWAAASVGFVSPDKFDVDGRHQLLALVLPEQREPALFVPFDGLAHGTRGAERLARVRNEGDEATGSSGEVGAEHDGVGALARAAHRARRGAPLGRDKRLERLRPQRRAARRCAAARVLALLACHVWVQQVFERQRTNWWSRVLIKGKSMPTSCPCPHPCEARCGVF